MYDRVEITHIEVLNKLIHSLSHQLGDIGVVIGDEIIDDNPPKHPNTIEFDTYYQTFLDRWSESLEPQSEHEYKFTDKMGDGVKPNLEYELDLKEDPEWKYEDDFRLKL